MFTKIIKWREIARFFKEIRKNLRDIYKKKERQIALSLSVGGGYLLSHFRSTIGVVRLNFSVRNGKRWDPHAITTLVRFQYAHQLCGVAPVIRLKEISGNAGLNPSLEQASRIRAPSALRKASGRLRPHSGLLHYRLFRVGRYKNHTGKLSGD